MWLYIRQAIKQLVQMFVPLCDTLILVCHVKEKQITKNGTEMSQMELDLAGKTGNILSGEADAIGYVYREGAKTFISFEGGDNIIREARSPHLRNKKFVIADSTNGEPVFDASQLFV
jgi:AAA domain